MTRKFKDTFFFSFFFPFWKNKNNNLPIGEISPGIFLARYPQLPFHEGNKVKDHILSLEALIGMMIEKNCSYIDDSFYAFFFVKECTCTLKKTKKCKILGAKSKEIFTKEMPFHFLLKE